MKDFFPAKSNQKNRKNEQVYTGAEHPVEQTLPEILSWEAPDHNTFTSILKQHTIIILIFACIIGYALYTESPIMAVTFILAGIVWFMISEREPGTVHCSVSSQGVVVGNSLYEYNAIQSFCILYQREPKSFVSFRIQADAFPYLHISLGTQDPETLRTFLLQYIPEKTHRPGIVDMLDRFF